MQKYSATTEITINASAGAVWHALVTPDLIKQYMFGTDATSDWQKGRSITYSGEFNGQKYEDKGVILEIDAPRKLVTSYYSSMVEGQEKPENQLLITYEISESNGESTLKITQANNKDRAAADTSQKNWRSIADAIKKLVETPDND